MSMHVTERDEFYQAFPMVVLQQKNVGMRRPGYKAMLVQQDFNMSHIVWLLS